MINRARRYWHTALCQRAIMSAMPWQWHPALDAIDPEQKSNAADKAFPLVPIDRTPPRHAVRAPVPQGTVVSQTSGNDQRRNWPFSGDCTILVVVGCAASPRQRGTALSLTSSGFSSSW